MGKGRRQKINKDKDSLFDMYLVCVLVMPLKPLFRKMQGRHFQEKYHLDGIMPSITMKD
jgi:hypothetical protein